MHCFWFFSFFFCLRVAFQFSWGLGFFWSFILMKVMCLTCHQIMKYCLLIIPRYYYLKLVLVETFLFLFVIQQLREVLRQSSEDQATHPRWLCEGLRLGRRSPLDADGPQRRSRLRLVLEGRQQDQDGRTGRLHGTRQHGRWVFVAADFMTCNYIFWGLQGRIEWF